MAIFSLCLRVAIVEIGASANIFRGILMGNERLGNERLGNERLGNERLGNERLGNERPV